MCRDPECDRFSSSPTRFPEAAPEPRAFDGARPIGVVTPNGPESLHSRGRQDGLPAPSARTVAAELNDRPEPTINAGLPKCETCGEALLFSVRNGYRKHECRLWMTPAERAFLRALAEHCEHWGERLGRLSRSEISERGYAMRDAARRVVSE